MKRLSILATILLLGACASQPAQVSVQSPVVVTSGTPAATPAQSQLAKLQAFTLADLQAANADALAQSPPDVTSSQCYTYLIAFLPTIQGASGTKTVGAIMAFQKARDLVNGVQGSGASLKKLNLACAPLVIDVQTTVNQLALQLGGAAAGASVGLPTLP
jgi:peptidoglycan hydrolase-like protein with peptidoglycan-binding domain